MTPGMTPEERTPKKGQRSVVDYASSVQTFRSEKHLRSILVSKEFLSQLEDYVLQQVPTLTPLAREAVEYGTCMQITDHFGAETVGSMKDYKPSLLPNTTSRVVLRVRVKQQPKAALDLEICFGKGRDFTTMDINYTGTNAREIVLAMTHGFERLMEPHVTRNWFYHPRGGFTFVPGIIAVSTLWLAGIAGNTVDKKISNSAVFIALGFIVAVAAAYWAIGARLRPFSSFRTNAFEHQKNWADWAERAVATFVIFGVFFAALKDKVTAMLSK